MRRPITVWLGAAVVFALLSRLALLTTGWPALAAVSDDDEYLARAERLIQHVPLATAMTGSDGVLRPPLYPLLLLPAAATSHPLIGAAATDLALGAAAVAAMFVLGVTVAGSRAGLCCAWLSALWMQWTFAVPTIRAEHLLIPLEALALASAVTVVRKGARGAAMAAGLLLGGACLTRSGLLPASVAVIAAVSWMRRRQAAVLLLAFVSVTGLYTVVLSRSAHAFVPIDNLITWNAESEASLRGMDTNAGILKAPGLVLDVGLRQPAAYLRNMAGRVHYVTFSPMLWDRLDAVYPSALLRMARVLSALLLAVVFDASVLSWTCAEDRRVVLLFVIWILAYLPVVAVHLYATEVRHRVPIEPALMALSAITLVRVRFRSGDRVADAVDRRGSAFGEAGVD